MIKKKRSETKMPFGYTNTLMWYYTERHEKFIIHIWIDKNHWEGMAVRPYIFVHNMHWTCSLNSMIQIRYTLPLHIVQYMCLFCNISLYVTTCIALSCIKFWKKTRINQRKASLTQVMVFGFYVLACSIKICSTLLCSALGSRRLSHYAPQCYHHSVSL